jgi:hypothetical protein
MKADRAASPVPQASPTTDLVSIKVSSKNAAEIWYDFLAD